MTEIFASPFNQQFNCYFSLFEQDKLFGSIGNFFDEKNHFPEFLQANPPHCENVISQFCEHLYLKCE
jgi:hypothetical protein